MLYALMNCISMQDGNTSEVKKVSNLYSFIILKMSVTLFLIPDQYLAHQLILTESYSSLIIQLL